MADVNDKMIKDIASMIGESADDVIREHYSYSDDYKTGQKEFDFSGGPIEVDSDPFYVNDEDCHARVYSIKSAKHLWEVCEPIDYADSIGQRFGNRAHSIYCHSPEEAAKVFSAYGRGGPMFQVEIEEYEGQNILCSNDFNHCYFEDETDALKDPHLKELLERIKAKMIRSMNGIEETTKRRRRPISEHYSYSDSETGQTQSDLSGSTPRTITMKEKKITTNNGCTVRYLDNAQEFLHYCNHADYLPGSYQPGHRSLQSEPLDPSGFKSPLCADIKEAETIMKHYGPMFAVDMQECLSGPEDVIVICSNDFKDCYDTAGNDAKQKYADKLELVKEELINRMTGDHDTMMSVAGGSPRA